MGVWVHVHVDFDGICPQAGCVCRFQELLFL